MIFSESQLSELNRFKEFSLDTALPFTHQETKGDTPEEFICCDW
jgi:hypothetical protein